MNEFKVWTLLPTTPGGNLPVHKHIPLSVLNDIGYQSVSLGEELLGSSQSLKQTSSIVNRLCGGRRDYDIGVGVINVSSLEEIDWSSLGNGVAYVFPRDNLLENCDQYGLRNRMARRNTLAVHVYPLPLIAAFARCPLASLAWRSVDLRHFYVYGKVSPGTVSSGQRVKQMHPRRQVAVFNGKVLDYSDICMKDCPRKLFWSLGKCALLTYNCLLGTETMPALLQAPEPNWDAFFGSRNWKPRKEAIIQGNFSGYWADNLVTEAAEMEGYYEERKQLSQAGGDYRRLKRLLCSACWLHGKWAPHPRYGKRWIATHYCKCGQRPKTCRGPVFRSDMPKQLRERAPWEYHVLAMRAASRQRGEFTVAKKEFQKRIPSLRRKRSDLTIVRPIASDNESKHIPNYCCKSPASKRATRRVMLTLDNKLWTFDYYLVSYAEWCRACKVKQVKTWKQLCSVFPFLRDTTDQVHLALNHLLPSTSCSFDQTFHFSEDEVGYSYSPGRCWAAREHVTFTDQKQLYSPAVDQISEERAIENEELRQLILDKELNFTSVASYLQNKRQLGEKKARAMMTKKPRIVRLPLFEQAGVTCEPKP